MTVPCLGRKVYKIIKLLLDYYFDLLYNCLKLYIKKKC